MTSRPIDRLARDDDARIVRRHAEHVVHQHGVDHRRKDRAETVAAVQPLVDERARLLDGAAAREAREERLDALQHHVDRAEDLRPRRFLMRRPSARSAPCSGGVTKSSGMCVLRALTGFGFSACSTKSGTITVRAQ